MNASSRRALHSSILSNSTCVATTARKVRLMCFELVCMSWTGVSSDTLSRHSVLLHQCWNSSFALYLRRYQCTVCSTARAACFAPMQLEVRTVYSSKQSCMVAQAARTAYYATRQLLSCKAAMIGKSSSDFSVVACLRLQLLLSNHCPPTYGLVIQVLPVNVLAAAELPWALAVPWLR